VILKKDFVKEKTTNPNQVIMKRQRNGHEFQYINDVFMMNFYFYEIIMLM